MQLLFLCNRHTRYDSRAYRGLTFAECVDKAGLEEKNLISIGAYCLMPNHFHVLVRVSEHGDVSLFMQKLLTAYTMYFNARNGRKGHLFESSFLTKHVTDDRYLKYLFSYIHLNPAKHIAVSVGAFDRKLVAKHLSLYEFSSLADYVGTERSQRCILQKECFPNYFSQQSDRLAYIFDWLEEGEDYPILG